MFGISGMRLTLPLVNSWFETSFSHFLMRGASLSWSAKSWKKTYPASRVASNFVAKRWLRDCSFGKSQTPRMQGWPVLVIL